MQSAQESQDMQLQAQQIIIRFTAIHSLTFTLLDMREACYGESAGEERLPSTASSAGTFTGRQTKVSVVINHIIK